MSEAHFSGSFPAGPSTGEVIALFRGEIFNAPELAAELGRPVDTPVEQLLALGWRRWDAALLPRLNGVFALAIVDGGGLLLYREPSSLHDLYWHRSPDGKVSYATDLSQLMRLPGVTRRIDRGALHEYLRFLDISAPRTIFEGVQSLEAGQALRCDPRGRVTHEAPARYAVGDMTSTEGGFEAAVDALEARLQHAIDLRLAGSARPAVFLSGGIDSSLICALARRSRPDLTALTIGFDTAPYDEGPVAARVAAQLGIAHQVLRFGRSDYLGAVERLCRAMGQPMADPATPATLLAFEYCRERFDVVLDGTGADEAVGMLPPRHVRMAVGHASLLPGRMRRVLVRLMRATPGLAGYAPIVDFEHPADTMIRWKGFTRPEIEALCDEPVSFEATHFYRTFARFPRHAHFERGSALLEAMPCGRLNQAALASGLQPRYPFADGDTDRFIRQLRTDWRWSDGEPKRILRAALARHVPRSILALPKHGLNFPLRDFLAADDFMLVRRYLAPSRWRNSGLLCADGVQQCARDFISGDDGAAFRIWALVMLGAWLEKHDLTQVGEQQGE